MKYTRMKDLIDAAVESGRGISDLIIEAEALEKERSRGEVIADMKEHWRVMKESMDEGIRRPRRSVGGLIGGEAELMWDYAGGDSLSGELQCRAAARALAVAEVNASMGKIVACPTAGSSGVLPGVLMSLAEKYGFSEDRVADALFTASGIGMVIALRASVSGAQGGCQAECGSAAAMAAGAAVEIMGGTPGAVGEACAMALKNVLGLVCDPVAGLVEVPCAKRNVLGTSLALISCDMALAGITSFIPVDEVIDAMGQVGDMLPAGLRETSLAGLAVTQTAAEAEKRLFGRKDEGEG